MDFIDFITIIERDHTYQNPTSMAKLDLLVEYCQIEDGHRVLDIGCGKGWLLQRIAEQFAVKADGVELNPAFIKEGKDRLARAHLKGEIAFHQVPASQFAGELGTYDVCCCIGASFAIGTFEEMVAWLRRYVRPGGIMAIGDIYARKRSVPPQSAEHFCGGAVRTLQDTVQWLNREGMTLVGLIDSSQDDWDRYESKHWRAADAWARQNPNHPELHDFLERSERFKCNYLQFDREALGWALFVSRIPQYAHGRKRTKGRKAFTTRKSRHE